MSIITKAVSQIKASNGIKDFAENAAFALNKKSYTKKEQAGNGGSDSIAHVTYYASKNVGDTALSQCVRRTIQYKEKVGSWDLISVGAPVTDETIARINSCSKLIIGGGGLFLPDTNKNPKSGWQWAVSNDDLDRIEVPVCVYSVGYNYFHGQEPGSLFIDSLQKRVEKSAFVGLRNSGSIEAIRGLLPDSLKEKVVFQPCTTTVIRKIYDGLSAKKETGQIALNMAFDRAELRYGANKELILTQVARSIKALQDKGLKVNYVCHCVPDIGYVPYLKAAGVNAAVHDFSRKFPEQLFDFYNKMDVVIGMRGHAQMIPFGLNCRIISLGSHDKMRWFLDDIDAADWFVDLSADPAGISERVLEIFDRVYDKERGVTERRLIEAQDRLFDTTVRNLEIISKI